MRVFPEREDANVLFDYDLWLCLIISLYNVRGGLHNISIKVLVSIHSCMFMVYFSLESNSFSKLKVLGLDL